MITQMPAIGNRKEIVFNITTLAGMKAAENKYRDGLIAQCEQAVSVGATFEDVCRALAKAELVDAEHLISYRMSSDFKERIRTGIFSSGAPLQQTEPLMRMIEKHVDLVIGLNHC